MESIWRSVFGNRLSESLFMGLKDFWDYIESELKAGFSNLHTMIMLLENSFSEAQNEEEYNNLVSLLDDLIDEVGENENHHLASLMELIGTLIEKYETEN